MGKDCHRCGSPLGSPEAFCPNCGSPQLLYDSFGEPGAPSTEVPPPPRKIDWKQAITAATTFAVPVGFLCSFAIPAFAFGFFLWSTAGSVAGVWLYHRRAFGHRLGGGAGTRIGMILGLMAATITAALNAGVLAAQRYLLHGGDSIDKVLDAGLKQNPGYLNSQLSQFSPDQVEFALRFWGSPDGHTAMILIFAGMWALCMVVLSSIGGAFAARIFSGPSPAIRNT